VDLPFEPTLNFIGLGVTAVDDPGNNRINITIPGFLAHDLLDNLQNQDTVAGVAVQGALIKGNAGGDWERFLKGTAPSLTHARALSPGGARRATRTRRRAARRGP